MQPNPVRSALGRRLRLGIVGGGPGSFIGGAHQRAALLDDCYEIVTGVVSSDPDRARRAGREMGFPPERTYGTAHEMLDAESAREDCIDVVAIMTPNDTHYEYATAALEHGLDVICDKPMTNTLEEAESLHAKVTEAGRVFCLTHNYSGYPMTRQAKAMVDDGQLGTIRLVQVEYVQGGRAYENDPDPDGDVPWRFDPSRGGLSLVLNDVGTHAHHLVRFVTGLEVAQVSAEVGTIVPGRRVHDFAGALLRFDNGARGSLWITQAAAGVENCLRLRVSGTRGTLEWEQEIPQVLTYKPLGGVREYRTPNGPGMFPLAKRSCRLAAGHPGGFIEAFASIYSDAAEAIAARRAGGQADPLALYFPTSRDGLEGLRFIHCALASSRANGAWIAC